MLRAHFLWTSLVFSLTPLYGAGADLDIYCRGDKLNQAEEVSFYLSSHSWCDGQPCFELTYVKNQREKSVVGKGYCDLSGVIDNHSIVCSAVGSPLNFQKFVLTIDVSVKKCAHYPFGIGTIFGDDIDKGSNYQAYPATFSTLRSFVTPQYNDLQLNCRINGIAQWYWNQEVNKIGQPAVEMPNDLVTDGTPDNCTLDK